MDKEITNTNWSEADEYNFNIIFHLIDLKKEINRIHGNEEEMKRYKTLCDWLRTLKKRITNN